MLNLLFHQYSVKNEENSNFPWMLDFTYKFDSTIIKLFLASQFCK